MAAQFPTNPLDMRGLCSRYTAIDGAAHIYLLRYQTPAELMSIITSLIDPVYAALNGAYFGNTTNGLIGLGYFRLSYDGHGNMSADVYNTGSIPNVVASLGTGKPTLTTDQFLEAGNMKNDSGIPIFVNLVHALVYKAFLELFIQSNLRYEVPFSCVISLDLYASRNPGQALLFHKDATTAFPTKFFTLTYVIGNPDIVVKGPTIVTAEDLPDRSAVTPAVRHGTTVGIDNGAVLHATPDPYVAVAMPGVAMEMHSAIHQDNIASYGLFKLKTKRDSSHYEGAELAPERVGRQEQVARIEHATGGTQRSFIRTWYNVEGFPQDPNPTTRPVPLTLTIQAVTDLVNNIFNNTCFIETGTNESPEVHLSNPEMQRISLGGAETPVNYAQRTPPLEQYKPVIGKELQNTSEQKSKPSIGSILASPEFKKLVASTDNFILRAVVKEKDAAPAMGGKYVSRSKKDKKRTLKRGKRSRTTHRMGGRKLKTKAQRQRQTKRKRH